MEGEESGSHVENRKLDGSGTMSPKLVRKRRFEFNPFSHAIQLSLVEKCKHTFPMYFSTLKPNLRSKI